MAIQLVSAAGNGTGGPKKPPARSLLDGTPQAFTYFASGTFNGATAKLEIRGPDDTTWFDTGVALTAAGAVNVEFSSERVRAVITGGGATTSITAYLS